MSHPTRYEIEIRGRATERALRPALDDFLIETTDAGTTRLLGDICDASHLNGLLAHFTSMNVEVVGLRRIGPDEAAMNDISSTRNTHSQQKGTES